MAIIHYFGSSVDDFPNVTTPHSWVEEDASWWVGIQQCGAQLALTIALTLASSAAAVATQAFSFHQDDPALTAAYEDEQTWWNQVAPYVAPNIVPSPWGFDEQTPVLTAGYVDEQTWQNGVAPTQWVYVQTFPDLDEIPAAFLSATYLDEQTWWNQVPSTYWTSSQIFTDNQDIVSQVVIPLIPDDNELWQNPVFPFVAPNIIPQSWSWDEQTPFLFGQADDNELWQNQVAPYVAPNITPLTWQWDEQTPFLFGRADENEIWQNPVAPISSYPVPQLFIPDEIALVPFVPVVPEEDFWWNQAAPYVVPTQIPQPWSFDEQTPALIAPISVCSQVVVPDFVHQMPDTMVMDICRNSVWSDAIRQAAACELISRLNTRTDLLTWKNYFIQGLIQTPVPLQFLIDFFEVDDTTQDKQLDGRFVKFIDAAGE